jgi:hypothetical protein
MKGHVKRIFNRKIENLNTRITSPTTGSENQFYNNIPVNITLPFHDYEKLVALVKKTKKTVNVLMGDLIRIAYNDIGSSVFLPNKNIVLQIDITKLFDKDLLDY